MDFTTKITKIYSTVIYWSLHCTACPCPISNCQHLPYPQTLLSLNCLLLFSPFFTTPSVEPEWQQWGSWSQCTSSCGEGVRIRARACSGSDQQCLGDSTEAKACNIAECPGNNWLNPFIRVAIIVGLPWRLTSFRIISSDGSE